MCITENVKNVVYTLEVWVNNHTKTPSNTGPETGLFSCQENALKVHYGAQTPIITM